MVKTIKDVLNIDEQELRDKVLTMVKNGYLPIQPIADEVGVTGATLTAFLANSRGVDYRTLLRISDWVKSKEKKEKK